MSEPWEVPPIWLLPEDSDEDERGADKESSSRFDLPDGARSWDELLARPLRFAPWPYTFDEIDRLKFLFSKNKPFVLVQDIILTARTFICLRNRRAKRAEVPNPKREIETLIEALLSARRGLEGLSDEALHHLANARPRPHVGPEPSPETIAAIKTLDQRAEAAVLKTKIDLLWAMDRFERDNTLGLKNLPITSRGGRPDRNHETWLVRRMRRIAERAHGGKLPSRGWPAFRDACVLPMGLRMRSEKDWQDMARPAKGRTNLRKKG